MTSNAVQLRQASHFRMLIDPRFRHAREEGLAAWMADKPLSANPYPANSGESVNFVEGWMDGHRGHS